MRTTNVNITNALAETSIKTTGRLYIWKSRTYKSVLELDNRPSFATGSGLTKAHIPESIQYNDTLNKILSVVVHTDISLGAVLSFLLEDTSTELTPTIGASEVLASAESRPGLYGNYVFWHDRTSWKKATFDAAKIDVGDADCLGTPSEFSTLPSGSIIPLSETEAIIFHIDEGAIRPVFVASDGSEHEHQGRIFNPLVPYLQTEETHRWALNYTAAVKFGNSIFCYVTSYDGSVIGAEYHLANDEINGFWSDYFTAIPQDLSSFEVSNAVVRNSNIFLCGSFYRKEEFATDTYYTMVPWSIDGKTFSLDRRILITSLDYRFNICVSGTKVFFSSLNRYISDDFSYRFDGEDAEYVSVSIIAIRGDTGSWSLRCIAGGEEYFDNVLIIPGAYARLDAGILTENGTEYVKYHDVIVQKVSKTIEDGVRTYNIDVVADGLWHTSSMSHPFYIELQGKQSILDDLSELDNLYKVDDGNQSVPWVLTQDFVTKELMESGGFPPQEHAASTTTDFWCSDIKESCVDYPLLGDSLTVEARLYGWSRAGKMQDPDDTTLTTPNDSLYILLLVEDANGIQSTVVSTLAELESDHSNFPQTYFTEGIRVGSYPITYQITNPGADYKLIKTGARVISTSAGSTVFFLERIELPGITVQYLPSDYIAPDEIITTEEANTFCVSFPHGVEVDHVAEYVTSNQLMYNTMFDGIDDYQWSNLWYLKHPEWGNPNLPNFFDLDVTITLVIDNAICAGHSRVTSVGSSIINEQETWVAGETKTIEYHAIVKAGWTDLTLLFYWYCDTYDGSPGQKQIRTLVDTSIILPEGETLVDAEGNPTTINALTFTKKASTNLLFSQTPYSAFNFEETTELLMIGSYAKAGLVGVAGDNLNYVIAYLEAAGISIAKIRNGTKAILDTYAITIEENVVYDFRFWHRDGLFGAEVKEHSLSEWPIVGSQLSYEWKEIDGAIATIDDLYHVGIYSLIDPPRVRITGFYANQGTGYAIPILPLDMNPETGTSDFVNRFPATWGKLKIGGHTFNYGSKITNSTIPMGPFQVRNYTDWTTPFTREGVHTFPDLYEIEFTLFSWQDYTHAEDFVDRLIGTSTGFSWPIVETQWIIWITTGGQKVWLRNRSRHYYEEPAGFENHYTDTTEKIYITNGFFGISCEDDTELTEFYPEGTFAYLDSEDRVVFKKYYVASGNHDLTISTLLQRFCRLAGTDARFIGDKIVTSATLVSGTPLELQ